jgi:hypothetical protein
MLLLGVLITSLGTTMPALAAAGDSGCIIMDGFYRYVGPTGLIGSNGFNIHAIAADPGRERPDGGIPAYITMPTYGAHRDYGYGEYYEYERDSYTYYYNASSDETLDGNPLFMKSVLNIGTDVKDALDLSLEQWRDLRYCILYSNINKDRQGQYAYYSYLAEYMPEKYSNNGGLPWQNEWLTRYFGAMGGAVPGFDPALNVTVASGATINIGAQVDTMIKYAANGVDFEAIDDYGQVFSDVIVPDNSRIGPFRIEWTPDSDPLLAQLNCGPDKSTPPVFSLSYYIPSSQWDNERPTLVRFYIKGSDTPTTTVQMGQEFYVEYIQTMNPST